MKAKQIITIITFAIATNIGMAQENVNSPKGSKHSPKLSTSELKTVANNIETDWRYGESGILWFEDQGRLDH